MSPRPAPIAAGPTRAPEPEPAWRPRAAAARALLGLAALASLVAAIVHVMVVPEHMEQWWGYGWFFVVSAAAQLLLAAVLVVFALQGERRLPRFARSEGLLVWAGIAGNAFLLGLYTWTRAVGNFVGPMVGMKEDIETIDLVSKAAEVVIVLALAAVLAVRRR